jgi:hypothetical protein
VAHLDGEFFPLFVWIVEMGSYDVEICLFAGSGWKGISLAPSIEVVHECI